MIRLLRCRDLDLLRRLDADPDTFKGEELTDSEIKNSVWWIAWLDGEPVGYCGACPADNGTALYLSRAAVLKKARGLGIQKRMIAKRVRYGRKLGCVSIITYTSFYNPASANNLMHARFRLYRPEWAWVGQEFLYWRRAA